MTTTTVNPNAALSKLIEAANAAGDFAAATFNSGPPYSSVRYAWAGIALLGAAAALRAYASMWTTVAPKVAQ